MTSTCGPPAALSSPSSPSAPAPAPSPASCDKRSQRKLASFFKCFEGPFANHDGPTDFTAARPCARRAGLDVGAIASCFDSIENVTTVNNAVQKPFWDASQAVLAVGFPYVKINDQAQSANWPDLLSIVCDLQTAAAAAENEASAGNAKDGTGAAAAAPQARIPRGCEVDGAAGRRMTVELRGPGVGIDVFSAAAYGVALTQATNFIISNVRPLSLTKRCRILYQGTHCNHSALSALWLSPLRLTRLPHLPPHSPILPLPPSLPVSSLLPHSPRLPSPFALRGAATPARRRTWK